MSNEITDYKQLVDSYVPDVKKFTEGEVVKGKVIAVRDSDVVIDIGYKSEGLVPKSQFLDLSGKLYVEVGDEVDVVVEAMEDRDGNPRLSHSRAKQGKVWDVLEKAASENATVRGKVIEVVKSGLSVDVGLRGFLPRSQIDVKRPKALEEYVGEEMDFKIISIVRTASSFAGII